MRFSGKIADLDGKIVLPSVQGQYDIEPGGGGRMKWGGSFVLPTGRALPPGSYVLIPDSGGSANILVHQVQHSSQAAAIAYFSGSGPPP
jgi:hypothetical protein